jgi:hypothetical protein
MNNARAEMYHDLVCEHRKLSDEHSKLRLDLSKKGKLSRHTPICRMPFLFLLHKIFLPTHPDAPTHNLYRHSSAGTEEQVTELLKRVKELTGMPNPADLQLGTLYFKSF